MSQIFDQFAARYGPDVQHWLTTGGLRVLLILAGSFLLNRILAKVIRRIEILADDGDPDFKSRSEKRAATLSLLLRQISRLGIAAVAGMMILREFKVDIAPIIAGAGIVGVAVGFGAQSMVKDVISGFFILFEHQFDVGDIVGGAGVTGTVERISLRFTLLRDLDGRVHYIPNGEFRVVSNLTRGWSRAVIDIAIGYGEDVDRVQGVLQEVAEEIRMDPEFAADILEPMELLGVEAFGDSSVTIRVLLKTLPGRQMIIAREFRKLARARLDALGIRFPFPQRVVHTVPLPSSGAASNTTSPPTNID